MVYTRNIPAGTDRPSRSAGQFRENFNDLDDVFGIDHIDFSAAENRGMHNQLTMPEQAAAPAAQADIGMVYSLDNGDGRTELYYLYDTGALGNSKQFPLTCVKAFCRFTNATPPVLSNAYNVTTITRTDPTATRAIFTVTFTDVLTSAAPGTAMNYLVLFGTEASALTATNTVQYQNTNNDTFQILTNTKSIIASISFVVINLT